MKTVWKFPIEVKERQQIAMPEHAILHADKDADGSICLWAAVDTSTDFVMTDIIVTGTGAPLPDVGGFIGTVVDGSFVWHIFYGPEDG